MKTRKLLPLLAMTVIGITGCSNGSSNPKRLIGDVAVTPIPGCQPVVTGVTITDNGDGTLTISADGIEIGADPVAGPTAVRGRIRIIVDEDGNGEYTEGEPVLVGETTDPPPPPDWEPIEAGAVVMPGTVTFTDPSGSVVKIIVKVTADAKDRITDEWEQHDDKKKTTFLDPCRNESRREITRHA